MASHTPKTREAKRTVLDTDAPGSAGQTDVAYGYEHSNIRLAGFMKAMAWFVGVTLLCYVIVWYLMIGMKDWEARAEKRSDAATPQIAPAKVPEATPPAPRLQPSFGQAKQQQDWEEMIDLREAQAKQLRAKGWGQSGYSGQLQLPHDAATLVGPTLKRTPPTTAPAVGAVGLSNGTERGGG